MPGPSELYYKIGANRELKAKSKARAGAFKRASATLRDKYRDEFDKIKDDAKRYNNYIVAYTYALNEIRNAHREEFDILYAKEKANGN